MYFRAIFFFFFVIFYNMAYPDLQGFVLCLIDLFEDPNKIYFHIQLAFLQFNTNIPMNVIFMVV